MNRISISSIHKLFGGCGTGSTHGVNINLNHVITMTYTAGGEKLAKAVTGGATKNYLSGIEYSGANLEAIYFSEGRCTPDGTSAFFYEYTIKDHLGNARVHFRAGAGATLSHLENMHYYPFGMLLEGLGTCWHFNSAWVGSCVSHKGIGKGADHGFMDNGSNLSDRIRAYDGITGLIKHTVNTYFGDVIQVMHERHLTPLQF